MMIFLYCGATAETDVTRRIFRKSMSMELVLPAKKKFHLGKSCINSTVDRQTITQTVRVKGGMSLRNGMWHGLRNDISISAKKYVKQKSILLRASLPRLFFGRRFFWHKCEQGHPRSIFGKYLFGRRFEIQNFPNISCKIYCLPASPRIFEHLKNGIIAHF